MDSSDVVFQTAELGKVDVGGGGTIAYIMAFYGMNVIDCGVAVLNMHAPWEATSKADVYETKGYVALLKASFIQGLYFGKERRDMEELRTSDFYYELPPELIAQDPLEDRSSSRLMVLDKETGRFPPCI